MSAGGRRSLPWAAMLAAWGAAFVLSCRLTTAAPGGRAARDRSVASAMLGESRLAMAGRFYETADLYFHQGVEHEKTEAFGDSAWQELRERISPSRHVHLHGEDAAEMVPWLWLALEMDPSRAETYMVAAFWLAHEAGQPAVALEVLRRGQAAVPRNYEIQMEKGRILLRMLRLREAADAFDAGLAFWPGGLSPESDDARHDRASLLLYRALLHEAAGEKEQAIRALEQIVTLFPSRGYLRERIEALRGGTGPALTASAAWKRLLDSDAEARAGKTCPQEEAGAHGHPHPSD
jgi:hypothetical protein